MISFTFATWHHLTDIALAPFTTCQLAKSGWVLFVDRVQRLATKQNAKFTEGARKQKSYFNPFVDQRS